MFTLPMPNEEFDNGTVVASQWLNDDEEFGPLSVRVIKLSASAPFYAVVEATPEGVNYRRTHDNISTAVEEYMEG